MSVVERGGNLIAFLDLGWNPTTQDKAAFAKVVTPEGDVHFVVRPPDVGNRPTSVVERPTEAVGAPGKKGLRDLFVEKQDEPVPWWKWLGLTAASATAARALLRRVLATVTIFDEESAEEAARIARSYGAVIGERVDDVEAEMGFGVGFDVHSPEAIRYAREQSMDLVRGVDDTTREALRATLSDGIKAGESMEDIAGRIEDVFSAAAGPRAMTIARTETMRASNWAALQSYREAGIEKMEWLVAPDYDPFDDRGQCEEYDGEIVDVDKTFHGGVQGPPLHPNCRCSTASVVPEEVLEEAEGEEAKAAGVSILKHVWRSKYADPTVRKARIEAVGRIHDGSRAGLRRAVAARFGRQGDEALAALRARR